MGSTLCSERTISFRQVATCRSTSSLLRRCGSAKSTDGEASEGDLSSASVLDRDKPRFGEFFGDVGIASELHREIPVLKLTAAAAICPFCQILEARLRTCA